MHESFMDVIIGGATSPSKKGEAVKKLLASTENIKDDESTLLSDDEEGEAE